MNDKLFNAIFATSLVIGVTLCVTGLVMMRREKKDADKAARICQYHHEFEKQMAEYENDPKRKNEAIKFWKQILEDDMM